MQIHLPLKYVEVILRVRLPLIVRDVGHTEPVGQGDRPHAVREWRAISYHARVILARCVILKDRLDVIHVDVLNGPGGRDGRPL